MHAASIDIRCKYFGFYMLEFIWGYFSSAGKDGSHQITGKWSPPCPRSSVHDSLSQYLYIRGKKGSRVAGGRPHSGKGGEVQRKAQKTKQKKKKGKAAKGEGHATSLSKHPLSPDSRKSPWVLRLETEGQVGEKKPNQTKKTT